MFAKRVREKRRAGVVRKSGESGWASFCGVCVCAVGDLVRETNEHGGYGRLVVMVVGRFGGCGVRRAGSGQGERPGSYRRTYRVSGRPGRVP